MRPIWFFLCVLCVLCGERVLAQEPPAKTPNASPAPATKAETHASGDGKAPAHPSTHAASGSSSHATGHSSKANTETVNHKTAAKQAAHSSDDLAKGGKDFGHKLDAGHPSDAGKALAEGVSGFGKKVGEASKTEAATVKRSVSKWPSDKCPVDKKATEGCK